MAKRMSEGEKAAKKATKHMMDLAIASMAEVLFDAELEAEFLGVLEVSIRQDQSLPPSVREDAKTYARVLRDSLFESLESK